MKHCIVGLPGSAASVCRRAGVAFAAAAVLVACGGSDSTDPEGTGGTGGTGGGPPTPAEVGTFSTTPETCTEPRTICMQMQVPSTMDGTPDRLLFDIFDSPGRPNHLPNGYAGYFTAPELTAGQQLYFQLSDGDLQGDYWMWVIMYMEGGGYGAPLNGVDYIMRSEPAPLRLDGTPLNIDEPVVLGL